MTTAVLLVTNDFLNMRLYMILPPGFRALYERDLVRYEMVEVTIEGPFDISVPDGTRVEARITRCVEPYRHIEWQWMYNGDAVGNPIEMVE